MQEQGKPIHPEPFEGAGKTFALKIDGIEIRVEDYWDRIAGKSWMDAEDNPAAIRYGIRSGSTGLPFDDEVVYGKVGCSGLGHLVHVSELGEVRS
jgi:hypothetical protein